MGQVFLSRLPQSRNLEPCLELENVKFIAFGSHAYYDKGRGKMPLETLLSSVRKGNVSFSAFLGTK